MSIAAFAIAEAPIAAAQPTQQASSPKPPPKRRTTAIADPVAVPEAR